MDLDTEYVLDPFRFRPAHPHMMYLYSRERSYGNWPGQLVQKPLELASNGFFYSDIGDRVTCFYCNVTLKQWNTSDDIETEHLK